MVCMVRVPGGTSGCPSIAGCNVTVTGSAAYINGFLYRLYMYGTIIP